MNGVPGGLFLGEVKNGKSLGYKTYDRRVWHACLDCGKERWVILSGGEPDSMLCRSCTGKKRPHVSGAASSNWHGGRVLDHRGYWKIKLQLNDFFYPMVDKQNYVMEHRLVMAKHLGRCLHRWEIVHHKGTKYPTGSIENKQDNRIENLQLVTDDRHKQLTIFENEIASLKGELKEQAKLIKFLQWQLKEMRIDAEARSQK